MTPDDVRKLIPKLMQSAHGDEYFEQAMNDLLPMEQHFHNLVELMAGVDDLTDEEEVLEAAQRAVALMRECLDAYHRRGLLPGHPAVAGAVGPGAAQLGRLPLTTGRRPSGADIGIPVSAERGAILRALPGLWLRHSRS